MTSNYTVVTSDKKKMVAFVLCLLGGFFGVHHFYVGNIGKGILYFFTAGIFFIGWAIDLIKILTGTFQDGSGAPLKT